MIIALNKIRSQASEIKHPKLAKCLTLIILWLSSPSVWWDNLFPSPHRGALERKWWIFEALMYCSDELHRNHCEKIGNSACRAGWDCGLQMQWGSNEILKRPHYMWVPTTWCSVGGSWKGVGCIIRLLHNTYVQGAGLQLMNLEVWVWYCPTYCLGLNLNLKVDLVSYCWLQVRFSKALSLLPVETTGLYGWL